MKRLFNKLIAAGLLLAAGASTSNGRPNGNLDEILANMQNAAAKITSIQATLEQVKRDNNIGGLEKYNGEIFFKHVAKGNDKVKIAYSRPEGQTIWIVGDLITLYQAKIKQAIITSRSAAAAKGDEFAFVATPYTSVPDLKRQYNIVHPGDDQGMAKLELTPKAKSSIQKLTLWVDRTTWLPVKYSVVETGGNATNFVLTGVKRNQGIPDSVFKVDLPKDTKIIRR
ncbi:MAG TPA: outer-membrane lipoprotein carrier protein LolA [Blastocatellia bacterium]|jgi:outer membrane lipoprotein-sorting protein|nr:outer-membrane lipoprotein carrier protein LolA [Blastocatellia bacterium]